MEINENRIFSLTKFSNKIGDKRHKESDHNTLILNIQSNWVTTVNEENKREEIYNYKNKDDFQKFVKETENKKELVNCFDDTEEELEESADRWLSIVNKSIKKSFKRIRMNKLKQNKELDSLFQRKESLKSLLISTKDSDSAPIEDELNEVIEEIANMCAEKNKEITQEHLGQNNDTLEGYNAARTWNLKKRLAPKNTIDPPMAKKDLQGNLVTEKNQLEKLYLDTYVDRLKPNKISPGLELLEEMKEYLYDLRMELCKDRKSIDWTMHDLEKVLKQLKDNKARDAHCPWTHV